MSARVRGDGDSGVVAACYEAAIDPARWRTALELASRARAADSMILTAGDHDGRVDAALAAGVDPKVVTDYTRRAPSSPLVSALRAAPLCAPVYDRLLMPRAEFEKSAFYQDWARPSGLAEGMVSALAPMGPDVITLGAARERGRSTRPFTEGVALTRFAGVSRHFARAALIQRRLMRADGLPQGANAVALHALSVPALFLDARGRALWVNSAAETLLRGRDGLSYSRNRALAGASSADTARLGALIAAAAAGVGSAAQLRRPSGAQPLLALAAPSGAAPDPWRSALAASATPRIALFVVDPSAPLAKRGDSAPAARLRALFGLTAAEAATALEAASGDGLPAVAQTLGVGPGTVRTHAKAIFGKTGVRGQADLARLLTRLGLIEAKGGVRS
jgi:DNA-binding CsgD family transcriptional regulator